MNNNSNKVKIAIVGTGIASIGVLNAAIKRSQNLDIHIFDIGKQISDQQLIDPNYETSVNQFYNSLYRKLKREFGVKFPALKTNLGAPLTYYENTSLVKSEYYGGLSNFWGGTMLPFSDKDLVGFPFSGKDLKPHYETIAANIGISGRSDSLDRCFTHQYTNRPPITPLKGLKKLESIINSKKSTGQYDIFSGVNKVSLETRKDFNNACNYCGECMAGCYNQSLYHTKNQIDEVINKHIAKYVQGKVTKINNNNMDIHYSHNGVENVLSGYQKIFLCSGCIGTTEIVMRSLGINQVSNLVDNAIYQFPIVNLNLLASDKNKRDYIALSNIILECMPKNPSQKSIQIQIYPNFDYLWRNIVPEFLWSFLKYPVGLTRDHLLWARAYTHSDYGYAYELKINNKDELEFIMVRKPNRNSIKQAINSLRSVVHLSNGLYYIPHIRPVLSKTSSHYAGTLPQGNNLVEVDRFGQVMPNVYICDSSCFPVSPATSPTFTIGANAHRVACHVLTELLGEMK